MVRKRKNSEENTASPRQTRQITTKRENRNEPSTEKKSKRTQKNVAEERGRKRTRRHHTTNLQDTTNLDTSFASELDASNQDETNEAIHKRASTRVMKKATLNTNEEKLNSSQEAVVEFSPIRTRKRAKKGTDELIDKSDTSIVKKKVAKKRSPIKVSKAKRTPSRNTRSTKSKKTYQSSFAKDDSENSQKGLRDKQSSQSSTLNSSSANESDSMFKDLTTDESLNLLQKWQTAKNINDTPQKPSPRILRKRRERLPNETVTPQNSPIVVNLTPHRSTKTPKRSPLNLRSPKSHSQTPLRLSKSPRKLPIMLHSPAASDVSTVSEQNSPKVKANQTKDTMNLVTGVVKKILSPSLTRSTRGSSASPKLKTSPKYSKSPKIVLKSPKLSPGNNKRSFVSRRSSKTPQKSAHSPLSRSTASPEIVVKLTRLEIPTSGTSPRTSQERVSVSASKIRKSPIKLAASRSPIIKSPSRTSKVVLKRLKVRTPVPKGRKSPSKSPSLSTPTGTPLKTPVTIKLSPHGGDSPRRPKSLNKKRSPITDSGTPLRPIPTPENISLKRSASKPGLDASILTIPQETHVDVEKPLLSSTPRDRIARIMHLSPKLKTSSRIDDGTSPSKSSFLPTITLRENMDDFLTNCSLIENEEKPFSNETELINGGHTFSPDSSRKDGTFEIVKDDSALKTHKDLENDTYEVAEPKTPNFQKERRKRSMVDDESDKNSRQVKRTCRVRFARTSRNDSVADDLDSAESKSSIPPSLKTVQSRLPTSVKQYGAAQSRKICSPFKGASENLRRSTSMTNVEAEVAVIKPQLKRRSVSASDINTRTPGTSQKAQNASVSRLSRPKVSVHSEKKRDSKTPVARKAPNFAEIHQKKFAKMESLVDAKKRVEERHIVLSNNLVGNSSKLGINIPSLSSVGNGVCNRFGFRLRKPEAKEAVSKKRQIARPREKKKEETRTLLKGVRTNRRFELQMKSRNLHQ